MSTTVSSMTDSPVPPLARAASEGQPASTPRPLRASDALAAVDQSASLTSVASIVSTPSVSSDQQISTAHKYGLKLFAGALAGAVSDLVMHPIDTVRARQQVHRGSNISFYYTAKRVVHKHGIPGLYRGIGATMLLTIPIHAIFYAGYEFLREGFRPYIPPEKQPINDAVSGCIAEFFSCSFGIPYEVIKQRAQVHKIQHGVVPAPDLGSKVPSSPYASTPPPKRAASSWNIAKMIYKEDGMRGFYRGTKASILVWCPFASLYFAVYEKLKLATCNVMGRSEKDIPTPYFFPAGMGAACVSALVTNPLDIVRTRLQTQGALGAPHAPGDPTGKAFTGRYDGIVDAFRKIYKTEGVRAFSKGLFARSIWIMPYTTIGIISYEYMKRVFNLPPDAGRHH